jgi:hypothetical protein
VQFAINSASGDINWIFQKFAEAGWAEGTNRISDKSYLRNDHRWRNTNAPMEIGVLLPRLFRSALIDSASKRNPMKLLNFSDDEAII